ncbi:unnamed protein product [Thlaspi arvense]|uniref:Uncharacterized protein n=1 Tax=Thlaspi arvense TaxID=13288 RepID=A0AAU9T849_THLAR|nr:unnamed protein product [Thlaspi arvense]
MLVLRREVLDDVEAANVWMQRLLSVSQTSIIDVWLSTASAKFNAWPLSSKSPLPPTKSASS